MTYSVDCDTCDYVREFADEVTAYAAAKEHEAEQPDHFVFMERPV